MQGFIYGLLLGLLIGAGFFIFKIDSYFHELSTLKLHAGKNNTTTELIENKNEKNTSKKQKLSTKKTDKLTDADSLTQKVKTDESRDTVITKADTAAIRFQANENLQTEENIVVKKDALITSKFIDVTNLSEKKNNSTKDSLLKQVSGIDEKTDPSGFIVVEFWQSPLNYKGYKMSKNRVVVFGLNESDVIKLYKNDDATYLKTKNAVYKLEPSTNYRPFERVIDTSVLAKLK